ncbi:MAG: DNA mismatch endonuclease Vsr [Planctomycetota bacterium]
MSLDPLSSAQRSERMSLVRGKDTKPEMVVRRLIHRMGFRYRLHRRDLPGKPDLVFPSRRKVVFVHGCFWHRHACPAGRRTPKSRREFWLNKLESNRRRDQRNRRRLNRLGWSAMVIWECQLRDLDRVRRRVASFLDG